MDVIKLKLNDYQKAVLLKEFKLVDGLVKITRKKAIGKFIYSQILWVKKKPEELNEGIEVFLPDCKTIHQELNYPFLRVDGHQNIADFLQANFDINTELFFIKGYRQGFKQKDIINAFLYYYNLPWSITNYEMIKQRDFRKRKNVKRIISEFIANN